MKKILLAALLSLVLSPALAQTDDDCAQIMKGIEAKLKAEGKKDFYLDTVRANNVKKAKVVGDCDVGRKKIVYRRS